MAVIAIVGDIHANSTVALAPPRVRLDDGGEYVSSRQQRWIWRQWVAFWSEVGERRAAEGGPFYVVLNGELADDNHHATTQLISRNPADQLKVALQVLEPMTRLLGEGDRVFVLRGTEAHSGVSGSMDETLARELGAESCGENEKSVKTSQEGVHSWWSLRAEIDGVRLDVAHHPPGGGGRRPWTRGSFAQTLAAMRFFEAAERGERPPHLLVRGHVHRPGDSYDAYPVRAVVLPSWQLTTSYGWRIGGGFLPVGGAYLVTRGRGAYELVKRFTEWPLPGYWHEPDE
jgi:hypothetical protein